MSSNYFERLFGEQRGFVSNILNYNSLIEEMIESTWFKLLNKAEVFYQNKNFDMALNEVTSAINQNPQNPHLFQFRANVKEEMSDYNGAINDYKHSLLIGNDWYSIYNQIALCFLFLKNYEESLRAFDIAIELKMSLLKSNIDETTMCYYNRGIVIRVDYERMYANRANVKLSLKDYQGCLDDIKSSINFNENYSTPYFIAGLLFEKVGQKKECFEALQRAKELGHPQAEKAIKHFFT